MNGKKRCPSNGSEHTLDENQKDFVRKLNRKSNRTMKEFRDEGNRVLPELKCLKLKKKINTENGKY